MKGKIVPILVVLVIVLGGGVYWYTQKARQDAQVAAATQAPPPAASAPTPATAPAPAATQSDIPAIIRDRQQAMKTLGGQLRTINAFAKGESQDQAAALAAIDTVLTIAGSMAMKFPAGTDMNSVQDPKTGAKPEIWAEPDKFAAAILVLNTEAAAMKTAIAAQDPTAMQAAAGNLGKTGCGTCHSQFRAKID